MIQIPSAVCRLVLAASLLTGAGWIHAQGFPPELEAPGGTLRFNAGGGELVDNQGLVWKDDAPYLTTATNIAFFIEEFSFVDLTLLSDPSTWEPIFHSERWRDGDIRYRIPVRNAPYKVFVYFAEMCIACVGPERGGSGPAGTARIFDVEVEGDRYFSYDQADAAKFARSDGIGTTWKATELVFDASVTDGFLDVAILDLGAGTNPPENASIKGLKIVRMPQEISTPGAPVQLNVGGSAASDSLGRIWRVDDPYLQTAGTSITTTVGTVDRSLLEDPAVPAAVFTRGRGKSGGFDYTIPLPNGPYQVRLFFAETCTSCVGPDLGGTGCANCTRDFTAQIEAIGYGPILPADQVLPPAGDGVGDTNRATQLVANVVLRDHYLNLSLGDRGAGNPPGDPLLHAIQIQPLDALVLSPNSSIPVGLGSPGLEQLVFLESHLSFDTILCADAVESFGTASIYARWDGIPSAGRHDASFRQLPGQFACSFLGRRPVGNALLLVHSDHPGPEKFTLDLSASDATFRLTQATPSQAAADAAKTVALVVEGYGFRRATAFSLRRGGQAPRPAIATVVTSSTRAELVFDVTGAPAGVYDLHADQDGDPVSEDGYTFESGFRLLAPGKGPLIDYTLEGFGAYRRNELSRVTLRYRNEGDADALAPLFRVEGPAGVELSLRTDEEPQGNQLLVLGIDESGLAGRLAPGAAHEVHVYFKSSLPNQTTLRVSLLDEARDGNIPWTALPPPSGMAPAAWQTLAARLASRGPGTWSELHEDLAAAATRLHRRGEDSSNVRGLFRFLARDVLDRPTGAITGRFAQGTGAGFGTSSTPAESPVKGVSIVARSGGTTVSHGITDLDGYFTLDWLSDGVPYTVTAVGWNVGTVNATLQPAEDNHLVILTGQPGSNVVPIGCSACNEIGLPPRAVSPPSSLFSGERTQVLGELRSFDPNEKKGPRKPDQPGLEDAACPGEEMQYEIRFENTGNAAARRIVLRDTLDTEVLDVSRFRFVDVILPGKSFPLTSVEQNNIIVASAGSTGTETQVEDVGVTTSVCVRVSGAFEPSTGLLVCVLEALDPLTGKPPLDPNLGVLRPGEHGSFSFATAAAASGDIDEGTEVKNSSEIIFDDNPPVPTNTFKNRYSFCLPEEPSGPIPADDRVLGIGSTVLLGWESAQASSFQVFLGEAGSQRTRIANGITEHRFRPTGLLADRVYEWQVRATNSRGSVDGPVWSFNTGVAAANTFRRGDSNSDGKEDLSDAVFTLSFLFVGGVSPRCMKALDVDDDGEVLITDPVFLLNHLFSGSAPPRPPFGACGSDPSADSLPCPGSPACP